MAVEKDDARQEPVARIPVLPAVRVYVIVSVPRLLIYAAVVGAERFKAPSIRLLIYRGVSRERLGRRPVVSRVEHLRQVFLRTWHQRDQVGPYASGVDIRRPLNAISGPQLVGSYLLNRGRGRHRGPVRRHGRS